MTNCFKKFVLLTKTITQLRPFKQLGQSFSYHPGCLVCSVCSNSLSGKQFLKEKNGNLVCEECNAKTAPKCTKCKQTFAPGESYKKITDSLFYHNHCFLCSGPCHSPIGAEFYDMENGKFLCIACYDKYGSDSDNVNPDEDKYARVPANPPAPAKDLSSDFSNKLNLNRNNPNVEVLPAKQRERDQTTSGVKPAQPVPVPSARPAQPVPSAQPVPPSVRPADDNLCFKCRAELVGQYTVYSDRKYHTKCFVCNRCQQPFKEKTFFKLNDNPVCRECYTQHQIDTASKCHKCSRPIMDTVVTFKNGEYHDTCLVCTVCSGKLMGQSIYSDKEEKPYCVECFTKKEGKTCAKCYRLITPSQPSLLFDQKHFHKECFACRTCSRQIPSTESFYKSDDGKDDIICSNCI